MEMQVNELEQLVHNDQRLMLAANVEQVLHL